MKKLIGKIIDIVLWPVGMLMRGSFANIMRSLRWGVYVSVVKHRFKKSSNLNVLSRKSSSINAFCPK